MINSMRNAAWLGQVYSRVPTTVMSTADRALRYGQAVTQRRIPLVRLDGQLAGRGIGGNTSASVVVVDHQPSVAHFVQPLFEKAVQPRPLGHVRWRELPGTLDRLADEVDLVVARLHAGLGSQYLDERYVRLPEAVECLATLPDDKAVPLRARRGQARNLRVLRRSSLHWEVSHNPTDFKIFYEKMYVPFAQHRFGDMAYVRSEQRLRSHFLRGGLIRVLDDHQWVGGVVYSIENACLRVWVVGVIDGNTNLLHQGVMTANWAFAFEHAHQLGLRLCHMGLSRPSLTDGVLVYKKRWGAALRDGQPTHCDLFVRWNRFTPAVATLLRETPLIFHDGSKLSGLTAVDEPASIEQVERIAIELALDGLQRLCVLTPNATHVLQASLQDERVQHMDVRAMPQAASEELGRHLAVQADEAMPLPQHATEAFRVG